MAWACVPRKGGPPRISACRARRFREEGDEPDRWARAVRGVKATRGGLSGWLAGPAGQRATRARRRRLGLSGRDARERAEAWAVRERWERALGWPWAALGRLGKEVWAGSWVLFWVFPFYFYLLSHFKSKSNKG